jgi:glucosamine--fructose-6-phosphate aminotransferase (isomerizing)
VCGIVAVLRRPSARPAPSEHEVLIALAEVDGMLGAPRRLDGDMAWLGPATTLLREVNRDLLGTPGLRCLLGSRAVMEKVAASSEGIGARIAEIEASLESDQASLSLQRHEEISDALVTLKDAWWAIDRDRLGMARAVAALVSPDDELPNLDGWWAIQVALASLDRLEVRGRDSAGIHVLVRGHGLDFDDPEIRALVAGRDRDPLFRSGAVRRAGDCLSLVYKAAAEIGELGDNGAALRAAIRSDALLARALAPAGALATVVAHTRWASVGIISEPNAHPVNSDQPDRPDDPYVVAVLNGDVDNHAELRARESLRLAPEITTDAKVIPALISRRLVEGLETDEAFRRTVAAFEGSVAIAASSAGDPDSLHLAMHGSGQCLYIGLAEDAYVVASEPYGLVEETDQYVRMDGEATQGQVIRLDRDLAGTLGGMTRARYDGGPLPLEQRDVITAEINTRDVDRRGFHHFLVKELTEAPGSFRKTLRGRVVPDDQGRLTVRVGEATMTAALERALAASTIRRVAVIGQGTAAVAGQAVAAAIARCLPTASVSAVLATELSGFGLADDMSDTLVVAISQSGTTTDTNRTVDLARTRGAHIVAVVNRRNSDLVAKAHGVLYTSDGRDVEMSVASTKAFYAQIAAGWVLACALGRAAGVEAGATPDVDHLLGALRALPAAMEAVLAQEEDIRRIASVVAPPRRYWAVVGSGPDRVAAAEARIKLSELCYRSISSDATEDKKHIDLSSEPLILVCAAGLRGPNADDVAKEVAIYLAHNALPVVIVAEEEAERFRGTGAYLITVPSIDPAVAFVLSAMVGHVFGYGAALAIDAQARPLRAARAAIEEAATFGEEGLLERLRPKLVQVFRLVLDGLGSRSYNGNLEAGTAVQLVSALRYATGLVPLEVYEAETGKIGTPAAIVSDLVAALSAAIDELTRPIDAIKHQAKTVTVGISRSEDAMLRRPLVTATLAAGATPDALGYRALRTLATLDEAVAEVRGFTRYAVDWSAKGGPTAHVTAQGGNATQLRSRTALDPRLRGSKHRAAEEREVTVVRGASDGRTVVLVPETDGTHVCGLTLLHVRFHDVLPAEAAKRVLSGYRTRYAALSDAVTETEPVLDDERLGQEPIVELLTEPVYALARRWRAASQ